MKITLDLPEDLLQKSMYITDIQTKTNVVIYALQELIRKSELIELKNFKGKIELNIDLDKVRNRY